jgi:hypothetical protein
MAEFNSKYPELEWKKVTRKYRARRLDDVPYITNLDITLKKFYKGI